jgi:hypothetical protein
MTENTVKEEQVKGAIKEVLAMTVKEKTTIVIAELKNGFVIVESSSCVDKANYDEKMGVKICLDRIYNKIWELLGFNLQQCLYENEQTKKALEDLQ